MTGFLIAIGIIVLLVLIAAGYRRWRRGPQPPRTEGRDTYRDIKSEAKHRPDNWGRNAWEGPP